MAKENGDRRTIFLIEENDETRPLLAGNLRSYGYGVIVALDGEDALGRVGGGVTSADLVLVDLVGKSVEYELSLGRRVREHARYDGRPRPYFWAGFILQGEWK